MKNFNKLLLLLTATLLIITSCNQNEEAIKDQENSKINYNELNSDLKNYADSFKESFNSEVVIIESFNKYFKETGVFSKQSYKKEQLNEKINISFPEHYNKATEIFLLEYYNELINVYDYEIPQIISKYETMLSNSSLADENREQIKSILDASNIAVRNIETIFKQSNNSNSLAKSSGGGFWACMKKTAGKKIGRGMVAGAIRGAYKGAIAGAIGGTIVPGAGTISGAVAGGVIGGARGAVAGAVVGAFWASADCLSAIQKTNNGYQVRIEDFFDKENDLILDIALLEREDNINIELNVKP